MPRRIIEVDGEQWVVAVSGRITQYTKDEFGLVFTRGTGPDREQRVSRYSPLGAKSRELSLRELSDRELRDLLAHSQPVVDRARDGVPPLTSDRAAPRGGDGRSARALDGVRREPAARGGGGARAGRRDCRHRAHRPRYGRGRTGGRRGGRAAGLRVVGGCEFSAPRRPGERCTCSATSCRPHRRSSRHFLERCRADRVRRGQRDGHPAAGAGRRSGVRRRAAQSRGGAVGRPHVARAIVRRGRRHRRRRCVRSVHRPRPAGVRGQDAARRSARSPDLVHSVRRPRVGGAPQGARHALVPRAAQARGARRGRDPASQPRPRAPVAPHRTSHCGSACCGPAAATGTAIPSRARPTARSARRRCRSSGSSGWRGAAPDRRAGGAVTRLIRAGSAAARVHRARHRTDGRTRSTICCADARVLLAFYPGNDTPG